MVIYILSLRHAQIAQLVEQWTENPRVTGSIPVLGTFFMPKNSIKKATADLRMLSRLRECKCTEQSGFCLDTKKFQDGSSWSLLSSFFLVILKDSDLYF